MILCRPGPVFQADPVLDRDHKPSSRSQMRADPFQVVHKRIFRLNRKLRIFKYTDQSDQIILLRQLRLNILKISDQKMQVITVFMTIGIDQASLFRKIDDRHLPRLFTQSSGDRTRSCPDLQYIFTSVHRQPADDILPQI